MVSRLSELLERIRPAGTPGSAEDRVTHRAAGAAEELAAVRAALEAAQAEAEELVAAAERTAASFQAQAGDQAQAIRDGTPDRAARAAARAAAAYDLPDPALAELARQATHDVDARLARAGLLGDQQSQRVVAELWSLLDADAPTTGPGGERA